MCQVKPKKHVDQHSPNKSSKAQSTVVTTQLLNRVAAPTTDAFPGADPSVRDSSTRIASREGVSEVSALIIAHYAASGVQLSQDEVASMAHALEQFSQLTYGLLFGVAREQTEGRRSDKAGH